MKISEMQKEAHETATDKGWWEDHRIHRDGELILSPAEMAAQTALIHTEVAEATEDIRSGYLEEDTDVDGKPYGLPSELADILIRCGDFAGAMGIDLEGAVLRKLAYNKTRERRHGGKAL